MPVITDLHYLNVKKILFHTEFTGMFMNISPYQISHQLCISYYHQTNVNRIIILSN